MTPGSARRPKIPRIWDYLPQCSAGEKQFTFPPFGETGSHIVTKEAELLSTSAGQPVYAAQPRENTPPSSWPHPSGQRARSVPCDCLGFDCLGHEHTEDSLPLFPVPCQVRACLLVDETQVTLPRVQTLEVPLGLSFVPTAMSGGGLGMLGGVMVMEVEGNQELTA